VRLLDGRDEDKKLLEEEELDELVGCSTDLHVEESRVRVSKGNGRGMQAQADTGR